ncbi:MAG: hypothetical protein ACHQ49_09235 [Elusimicrobiota bacterium]
MKIAESDQAELLAIFDKGAAESARKLADVSGNPWKIHIVSLDVGTGERFHSILTRDEREYFGAIFTSPGETYLVLFSEDSGRALVDSSLPARKKGRRAAAGLEQSALAEIANVLVNGLSGKLADRHGMIRFLSAPTAARGRKAAIYERAFGALTFDEAMVDVLIHISSPQLASDCTVMLRLDSLNANFLLHTDPDAASADRAAPDQ